MFDLSPKDHNFAPSKNQPQIVNLIEKLLCTISSTHTLSNLCTAQSNQIKEILYPQLLIFPEQTSWKAEEAAVKKFYDEHNLDYGKKLASEVYHYKMLKAGMIQKIRATKYFHQQGLESRKLVFLNPISEDCISMIHWRTSTIAQPCHYMFVFIRSSNAIELLPMDMLYLLETYYTVKKVECAHPEFVGEINVVIGSAHVFNDGDKKRALLENSLT